MSDKRKMQNKPLIILQNTEDYTDWKFQAISKLQQESCNWAITDKPEPNLESVQVALIKKSFTMEDLRPAMLMVALRDEKKDYHVGLTKSVSLTKELVDKTIHLFLNNNNAAQIWTFLENKFQHISPMSVIRIFSEACNIKLSDCKYIMDNIDHYQVTFDKIQSLITKGS